MTHYRITDRVRPSSYSPTVTIRADRCVGPVLSLTRGAGSEMSVLPADTVLIGLSHSPGCPRVESDHLPPGFNRLLIHMSYGGKSAQQMPTSAE